VAEQELKKMQDGRAKKCKMDEQSDLEKSDSEELGRWVG
jgi:hypothetical protein